jgi:ribonuclease HII
MHIRLEPRADQNDGLVALASIVSKTIRELWMDVFNNYWCNRVPGLKRTQGYHTDAKRFRMAIEAAAAAGKRDPVLWWRVK